MQWENNDGSLRASVDRKAYVYSIRVFSRTFFFPGLLHVVAEHYQNNVHFRGVLPSKIQ